MAIEKIQSLLIDYVSSIQFNSVQFNSIQDTLNDINSS